LPLTCKITNTKAKEFAELLGNEPFRNRIGDSRNSSDAWSFTFTKVLMRTLKKHEKAEDSIVNVLSGLIEGYAADDIYNADETGLVFKCLPDKTYGFSNEKCHCGKKSKDSHTVMVCCNMIIIGKSKKPMCF
jgi:hypothetical protein